MISIGKLVATGVSAAAIFFVAGCGVATTGSRGYTSVSVGVGGYYPSSMYYRGSHPRYYRGVYPRHYRGVHYSSRSYYNRSRYYNRSSYHSNRVYRGNRSYVRSNRVMYRR